MNFGMSLFDMTRENFLSHNFNVFRFGRNPVAIVIMIACRGLDFEKTFQTAIWTAFEGIDIRVIHINRLIEAKKTSGRFKDLDDVEKLGG